MVVGLFGCFRLFRLFRPLVCVSCDKVRQVDDEGLENHDAERADQNRIREEHVRSSFKTAQRVRQGDAKGAGKGRSPLGCGRRFHLAQRVEAGADEAAAAGRKMPPITGMG